MNKEQLLILQQKYEAGEILEENMTNAEIEDLEKLYNEQIKLLDEMEVMYNGKTEKYKKMTVEKLRELRELNNKKN